MSAHTTGEYPYSVFPSPQGKNGMQANPSPVAKIHQPDYSGQADVFVFSIDLCDFPSKIEVLKCVDYPAQSILKCVVFGGLNYIEKCEDAR